MTAPVVIVDADRDGLEMYVMALALEGIRAEAASSGLEALDVIARTRPRAVVTELRLPDTCGTDLVQRVRRAQPDAFIVGLSTAGALDADAAREAGCDLVLPVPCLPQTLVDQIRHVLYSPSGPLASPTIRA
jgi:two-component system cell cycle response regulator DivK